MRSPLLTVLCLLSALSAGRGATLEKLSMDQIIEGSSVIVRARAGESRAVKRGPVIYTLTTVEVLERWKGAAGQSLEVALPGGEYRGLRQEFSGAPELRSGAEYVLFLWTSRSGLHHVIGLSQGIFTLGKNDDGDIVLHRAASGEIMLDPRTGQPMDDRALTIELVDLRERVSRSLGAVR